MSEPTMTRPWPQPRHLFRHLGAPLLASVCFVLPAAAQNGDASNPNGSPDGTPTSTGQGQQGQGQPGQGQPGQGNQGQGKQGQGDQGQGKQGQGDEKGNTPKMDLQGDHIVVSMSETNGLELPQFVKWAQEVTKRTFFFNEQDLMNQAQGGTRVSFLGAIPFSRANFKEEFYWFFTTVLYIKGFAIVPRGEGALEILEIISMQGPRMREVTTGSKYVTPEDLANYKNQTGVPVMTTVQLKHTNATVANNALRPFFASTGAPNGGGGVQIGNVGNSSALLFQGYAPQVYAAVELLKVVDVEIQPPNLVVQVVPLQFAAPEEIEPILTEVLESRAQIRQQVMQEANAGGGGQVSTNQPKLKIVVNSAQKSLVLSGIGDHVAEAMELIARLDSPSQLVEGTASVHHLKNVLADDLKQTLSNFMQADNNAEQQAQQGQAGQSTARRTRRTVIESHKESNSLLISAAPTKYQQIRALIDGLDRRQNQVLIEAALVELTTGDLKRYGVELGLIDLKENGNFTRGFGFTNFGQSVFNDTDDNGVPDTRLPDFDNPLQGITGGIISGGDFGVPLLISALATDDSANILSLPSVLVNNNETAVVKTEEERPTTNQTQNTTGTQTGNGTPRNAGITLEISPTISPNNYLRLNISLEVSRFVGAFDANSATGGGIILRRSLRTQVTMPTEATMVIGGVIEDSESANDGGIPFLKDIPILGYLFKKAESQHNKTNLYFFVTPTILDEDDFQDLWHMSYQKKLEAEHYIGLRRLQIVDRKWSGAASEQAQTLEDTGTTIEDLDAQSGFEMPLYDRGRQPANMPIAPNAPQPDTGTRR